MGHGKVLRNSLVAHSTNHVIHQSVAINSSEILQSVTVKYHEIKKLVAVNYREIRQPIAVKYCEILSAGRGEKSRKFSVEHKGKIVIE